MDVQPKRPTIKGPADWFTGDVFIDPIVQPQGDSPVNVGVVHFTLGARTVLAHPRRRADALRHRRTWPRPIAREDIFTLRPGDVHFTPDGQQHWHGADHEHFMTHISITQVARTWAEHVTDGTNTRAIESATSSVARNRSGRSAATPRCSVA